MREAEVLRRIRAIFDANTDDSGIIVGNGDDGAVLSLNDHTVIATDMAVEGIHFRLDWSSPEEIGRKITAANLADVCAMGGWPTFLVVSVDFLGKDLHQPRAHQLWRLNAKFQKRDFPVKVRSEPETQQKLRGM